jgi:ABC-type branched-subunit amino acid transport system substrate-binding protein
MLKGVAEMSKHSEHRIQGQQCITRRRLLSATGSLAGAGWVAGFAGSFVLHPRWAHADGPIKIGIATDITGALSPAGLANWQVAQFTVEQINDAGGVLGRPIELYLEDTATNPQSAVGNVRKLIQERRVDVVLGGISGITRQAIKDPIVSRGRTLYIYPENYEGTECTKYLFCTGPTPAQQCDELIPYMIKMLGRKRFAMPSANFVWPQVLNKYARKLIEANSAEVVFEEYYPVDQAEYSATIGKIRDRKADCVFNTLIPPGVVPFLKQLYESGFRRNGGVSVGFADEIAVNFVAAQEVEGLYSCFDYFLAIDDPFSQQLQESYSKRFPNTPYLFTAATGTTGMYRGLKFYEAAVKATGGKLGREEVGAAMDVGKLKSGPGGGAEMVPGKRHCKMNMYLAVCKVEDGKPRFEVISKADMVDPKAC